MECMIISAVNICIAVSLIHLHGDLRAFDSFPRGAADGKRG